VIEMPIDQSDFMDISSMALTKSEDKYVKKHRKAVPMGIIEQMAKHQNMKKI
jgi:hypothetical protein